MKTIIPGIPVKSLDQLYNCEFVMVRGKPTHRGWFMSWQLHTAMQYINRGMVFEGVRITKENKEDTNNG